MRPSEDLWTTEGLTEGLLDELLDSDMPGMRTSIFNGITSDGSASDDTCSLADAMLSSQMASELSSSTPDPRASAAGSARWPGTFTAAQSSTTAFSAAAACEGACETGCGLSIAETGSEPRSASAIEPRPAPHSEPCWAHLLGQACGGLASGPGAKLIDKFCEPCRTAEGVLVAAACVRALRPDQHAQFQNTCRKEGFWNACAPGGALPRYRIVNQTKLCTGTSLILFESEPDPTLEWGELPAEWFEGSDTVRLWLSKGTMVPRQPSNSNGRFKRERRAEPAQPGAKRGSPRHPHIANAPRALMPLETRFHPMSLLEAGAPPGAPPGRQPQQGRLAAAAAWTAGPGVGLSWGGLRGRPRMMKQPPTVAFVVPGRAPGARMPPGGEAFCLRTALHTPEEPPSHGLCSQRLSYDGLTLDDLPAEMREKLLEGGQADGESPRLYDSPFLNSNYDFLGRPSGQPLSPVLEGRSPRNPATDPDLPAPTLPGGGLPPSAVEPPTALPRAPAKGFKCPRCGATKRNHVCPGAEGGEGGSGGGGGSSGSGSGSGSAAKDASLNNRKEWAVREDQLIWQGVQQIGCKWRQIAAMLPGRSDDAVRNRYNRLKEAEASGLVRGENAEGESGVPSGTTSSGGGGGAGTYRCSKCGQLKKNHVCTAINSGEARPKPEDKRRPERVGWTKAEDAIITQSVQELGHRWFQIAERLPGRTDHAIRNRWHRLLTMRQEEQQRAESGTQPAGAPAGAPAAAPGAVLEDASMVVDSDAAASGAASGAASSGGDGTDGGGADVDKAVDGPKPETLPGDAGPGAGGTEASAEGAVVPMESTQDSPCEPLPDGSQMSTPKDELLTPKELSEL